MSVRKDKVALLVSELKGYDYVAAGNKVIVYFNSFDVECVLKRGVFKGQYVFECDFYGCDFDGFRDCRYDYKTVYNLDVGHVVSLIEKESLDEVIIQEENDYGLGEYNEMWKWKL